MEWIKRNLYFVIGSLVALALMGLAGYYLYSKWQLNNEIFGKLEEQYDKLRRLNQQKPHPGSPGKVDNVKAAKEQQQELRAFLQKAHQYFPSCPPIPVAESGHLTSQEFSSALSRTIDAMQRAATNASVNLPPKDASGQSYSFSFAAQKQRLAYAPGSLEPLAVQLGEVKAICSVLFEAKVNSLDELRRELVSEDDLKGPQTDYLQEKSVTNEQAVLSPYEVSFRCFSSELAAVLAGFATSPCGLMVKSMNVESAPAVAAPVEFAAPAMFAAPVQTYVPPPPRTAPVAPEQDAFAARYGLGPSRAETYRPPIAPRPMYRPAAPAGASSSRGGLAPALDEEQLKVTLVLNVVKLLPAK